MIDYLQLPGNAAELFCSAVRFLRYRLARDIEPLVMAFDPGLAELRDEAAMAAPNAPLSTGFTADDRLAWLQIDGITASGPLLPAFASAIRTDGLTDRQFADLLSAGFDR
ncbi:hypothetical protein [Mangrovicoccus ximenensis]|uniref:hypothetical protein n=1 Tax=Mangrovicoccus ximenensis TaxID=1911570 RepID=UPI000D3AF9E5|nr:hypothetical protein [Mangrovicoccus ximenensis]